jgi:hypothetical protein
MPADQSRLHADVTFLTNLHPARNCHNLQSLNKAADYIKGCFEKLRGTVTEQPFTADGRRYRNIIASFGPPEADRLIVGAHYDVCGDQPGADDNASAVAGLLETARLLHLSRAPLKHRIDFVAYPNEEPPYFATEHMGSAVHANSLRAAHVKVRAMLCYEMIGYFSDEPGSQNFPNEALAKLTPTPATSLWSWAKRVRKNSPSKCSNSCSPTPAGSTCSASTSLQPWASPACRTTATTGPRATTPS